MVQSVFHTFYRRQAGGQFDDLIGWDSLWDMLAVITLRKCGHQIDYFRAACRDVQREVATPDSSDDSATGWTVMAREPTPAEAVMLADTLESLMQELNERERQMVALSLQGYTVPEISKQVGRTERTVFRVMEHVREELEHLREAEG